MDNQRLGEVIGTSIANGQPPVPEDVLGVFTNAEILAAAESRGLTLANVAAESGQVATANTASSPVEVLKISDETSEKLNLLPTEFRERVVTRYAERYVAVDGYIRAGKLHEDYRLTELSGDLLDRVMAIAPAYEAIEVNGGEAEFDFVPQGLTIDQWSDLLKGHTLANGDTTTGAYRYHDESTVLDPTQPNPDAASLWDTAVMDVSQNPKVRGISADGSQAIKGVNLKQTIKSLKATHKALGLSELQPWPGQNYSAEELMLKQLSPDESTYFAMQLGRLERGEQPIDPSTWTIIKETTKVGRALYSVFAYFSPGYRRVGSSDGSRGIAYDYNVVRVSARGKDFILES